MVTIRREKARFQPYHQWADPRPLHEQMGIQTCVYRVPILTLSNHPKRNTRAFDPVNRVTSDNHLYRASVTLARV